MKFLVAGGLAALISWTVNTVLVRYRGDFAVIWIIPILEEMTKTSMAFILGASIPLTHLLFGLIEAIHDYVKGPRLGLLAGILSILGHGLFGWSTIWIFFLTKSLVFSILLVSTIHIIWNIVMVRLFTYFFQVKK